MDIAVEIGKWRKHNAKVKKGLKDNRKKNGIMVR